MTAQTSMISPMKSLCRGDGREACNAAGEDEVCVTMKEFIICGRVAGTGGWRSGWRVGEVAACFSKSTKGLRDRGNRLQHGGKEVSEKSGLNLPPPVPLFLRVEVCSCDVPCFPGFRIFVSSYDQFRPILLARGAKIKPVT